MATATRDQLEDLFVESVGRSSKKMGYSSYLDELVGVLEADETPIRVVAHADTSQKWQPGCVLTVTSRRVLHQKPKKGLLKSGSDITSFDIEDVTAIGGRLGSFFKPARFLIHTDGDLPEYEIHGLEKEEIVQVRDAIQGSAERKNHVIADLIE